MQVAPQSGLSLDQAPPISIPFRFFLMAPLFGFLAGILLFPESATEAERIIDRWSAQTLASTHLITLGFLGSVMMGAMLQMLPVLAGSRVPRSGLVAGIAFATVFPGITGLASSFLWPVAWILMGSLALLAIGLTAFLTGAGTSLIRAKPDPTTTAMRIALAGLSVTATLGVLLGSNHALGWWIGSRPGWTNTHALWGVATWIGALIAGVSFQVVPMFQLTPPYPRITRWLVPLLFLLVLLWTAARALPPRLLAGLPEAADRILFAVVALAAGYAILTLRLQSRRKRRVFDGPMRFWQVGLVALLMALAALLSPANLAHREWLLGVLLLVGFAVSLVTGMLYRIVPFLVWFHLQSALLMTGQDIPHMRGIIPDNAQRLHLITHSVALLGLTATAFFPPLLVWAAPLFSLSMALLGWNVARATVLYRKHITGTEQPHTAHP